MGKPGRKPKLTIAQVVDALKKAHGLKYGAAELLAVEYNTLQKYIVKSKAAQNVVNHWRKRRTERAVYKLDEAIEKGEAWAIAIQLKNSQAGRKWGYGERLDISGPKGGPIETKQAPTREELLAEARRLADEITAETQAQQVPVDTSESQA